jgi:hypothetical protein
MQQQRTGRRSDTRPVGVLKILLVPAEPALKAIEKA